MQEARHLGVPRLPGSGEKARFGGPSRGFHNAVERPQRAVEPGRAAGSVAVYRARVGHVALPHHRKRGLRGGRARGRQPLVRARRAHARASARGARARRHSVVYKRSLDVLWET